VPGLVAQRPAGPPEVGVAHLAQPLGPGAGGERDRLGPRTRQAGEEGPHVAADPPGHGLQELADVDGDGQGGHPGATVDSTVVRPPPAAGCP
jgi:hypothetical protein